MSNAGTLTDANGKVFQLVSTTNSYDLTSSTDLTGANLSGTSLVDTVTKECTYQDSVKGDSSYDYVGFQSFEMSRDGRFVVTGSYGEDQYGSASNQTWTNTGVCWVFDVNEDGSLDDHPYRLVPAFSGHKGADGTYDYWGKCVSVSRDGTYVAVSTRSGQGEVRIFERTNDNQYGMFGNYPSLLEHASSGKDFGTEIGIAGNGSRVIIGARKANEVYVASYDSSSGNWTMSSAFPGAYGASGGTSVSEGSFGNNAAGIAISDDGNRIAIGRIHVGNGEVQVLDYNTTTSNWEQVGNLITMTNCSMVGCGLSFSQDGSRIAVSDRDKITVGIFELSAGSWLLVGSQIEVAGSLGTAANFGTSVSLSDDGSIVTIGYAGFSGGGKVFIYKQNDNNEWVEEHTIDGTRMRAVQSHSDYQGMTNIGIDVSMSGDGSRVGHYGSVGTSKGSVSVYNMQFDSAIYANLSGANLSGAIGVSLEPQDGAGVTLPDGYSIRNGVLQDLTMFSVSDRSVIGNAQLDNVDTIPVVTMNQVVDASTRSRRRDIMNAFFRVTQKNAIRMTINESGVDASTIPSGKTRVRVIKQRSSINVATLDADEVLYSPIYEANDYVTLYNAGLNGETLKFMSHGNGTYSAEIDSVDTGATYNANDVVEVGGKWWLFGSVQETTQPDQNNSGGSVGDPYIVCIA